MTLDREALAHILGAAAGEFWGSGIAKPRPIEYAQADALRTHIEEEIHELQIENDPHGERAQGRAAIPHDARLVEPAGRCSEAAGHDA